MNPNEITVHIMEQNESFWIGYSLQALTQFFPHIFVYDTGSTDGTLEIIKSFPTVTLVEMGVLDRFQLGDCRNEMMRATKTPWVLQQDGDEYYPPSSLKQMLNFSMPEGKKLGFTLFYETGWDGKNFRAIAKREQQHLTSVKFNRAAVLWHEARYSGGYPFENPDVFDNSELFHYFPDEVVGYHLHHLLRSSKDDEVYLRKQKRDQFCLMDREVELGEVLDIEFQGDWSNPYLDYLKGRKNETSKS